MGSKRRLDVFDHLDVNPISIPRRVQRESFTAGVHHNSVESCLHIIRGHYLRHLPMVGTVPRFELFWVTFTTDGGRDVPRRSALMRQRDCEQVDIRFYSGNCTQARRGARVVVLRQ
jgi:hypothetical protein